MRSTQSMAKVIGIAIAAVALGASVKYIVVRAANSILSSCEEASS